MNGDVVTVDNYIGGTFVAPSTGEYLDVSNPANLHTVGKVGISKSDDVMAAVAAAEAAFPAWSRLTIKARASIVSKVILAYQTTESFVSN
jgi:acyl-CoA reductase-like NAD-dependent aldehyde dehydrogenase